MCWLVHDSVCMPFISRVFSFVQITSAKFQAFVEDQLLGEYYSPSAIRKRAERTAAVDGLTPAQTDELYLAMLSEVKNGTATTTVSDRTCRRWLSTLGFKWKSKQGNGVYHDGHERADVKADLHKNFLPKVKEYLRRTRMMREVIDVETGTKTWKEVPPDLDEGEREVIWVNQDESLFYANDADCGMWCEDNKRYIAPKGRGPKVHLSGFISYPSGDWVGMQPSSLAKTGCDNWRNKPREYSRI